MRKTGYRRHRIGEYLIGVHELGAGEEVFVLIHGIGVSSRYFMPLAKELARSGTVYVVELPGFGTMPKPSRALAITDYASLILGYIEYQGLHRPTLVGNSMGCQIVIEMLVCDPNCARAAVLVGPVVNPSERSFFWQAGRLLQDGFHEPIRVNAIVFSDYCRTGLRWYFKTLPHMLGYPIEEKVRQIRVPVLVVRGAEDPIVPHDWAARLASSAPDGQFAEISGAGHVVMYAQAEKVAVQCVAL